MRRAGIVPIAAMALLGASGLDVGRADAAPAPTVFFDVRLHDTSLEGETNGKRPDEQARLARLNDQLREQLTGSGLYAAVDTAAIAAPAAALKVENCGGCELDLARQVGAQVSVTGWVQKVSNLILNINVVIRDVGTGQVAHAGSVDIRGNTDESWSRGLRYLIRNRLLPAKNAGP